MWPLHAEKTKQMASFFAGSVLESMFDDIRGAHHTLEESQGEAYLLAETMLVPMIKRALFLEMEDGVMDGGSRSGRR